MGVFSRRLLGLSLVVPCLVAACANGGSGGDATGDDAAIDPGGDGSTLDGVASGDGTIGSGDGPLPGDGGTPPTDGAPIGDAPADAPQTPCSTSDAGLGGIGIPSGTVASASGTYMGQTPALAIDGNIGTYWNGGGTLESLTLTFPSAVAITGVKIAAFGSPSSSEMYTITGTEGGTLMTIGMATLTDPVATTIQPEIGVMPGSYTDITFHVTSSASWVAIAEVTLVTAHCP